MLSFSPSFNNNMGLLLVRHGDKLVGKRSVVTFCEELTLTAPTTLHPN